MRFSARLLLAVIPAFLLVLPATAGESPVLAGGADVLPAAAESPNLQPECPASWAIARLHCKKGAVGAAVGEYGGAMVSLFCNADRTEQALCVTGFSYGIRMSSESDVAVDCFFGGNGVVHERCGDVQLSIH